MLSRLGIETVPVDEALALHAAAVRAVTNLRLPDAFALATAVQAEDRGTADVSLASFDERVLKARASLD